MRMLVVLVRDVSCRFWLLSEVQVKRLMPLSQKKLAGIYLWCM